MNLTCEYCKGACEDGAIKCANCGAPLTCKGSALSDYRSCPYCRRRLLALASPACNYCGRRLPEEYIRARESDLYRMIEIQEGNKKAEVNGKVDEALLDAERRCGGKPSSPVDLLDMVSLTDLFS
jgi:hypothetical protein